MKSKKEKYYDEISENPGGVPRAAAFLLAAPIILIIVIVLSSFLVGIDTVQFDFSSVLETLGAIGAGAACIVPIAIAFVVAIFK